MSGWREWARLAPFLRPYRGRLAVVFAISLVSTALGLVQPFLSALLVDRALIGRDMGALWQIAGAMIGATVIGYAVNIAASWRYVRLSAAMLFDIRAALLAHLQTLSPRFHGGFRLGDLVSRLNTDVGEVQRVAADTLLAAVGNIFFLIGCAGMMAWLDWRLFLVGTLLVPVSTLLFLRLQSRLTSATRAMRERSADLSSLVVDQVMGMRTIVALGGEREARARFGRANDGFVAAMLRMQVASFLSGALPGTVMAAATAAVVLYGGARIIGGEISVGTLVAFMAYHARLMSPVQTLAGLMGSVVTARVSLGRLFELFDTPPEVAERADAAAMGAVGRGIELSGVTVAHGRGPVLSDLDLFIPAGGMTAILGPSGAGKSTLADLIARNLDPDAGTVRIDGRDVRDLSLADLRREVLLVDQTPWLFNDSIAANIAFGLDAVDERAMSAAIHAAGLDTLIARLPEGLATRVGERGLALSAGERQRVALARALLRRPSVLILDEPSSALDGATEALVAHRLRAALPRATLIVITHKPALAALADRVVTIEGGRARLAALDAAA